MFFNIEGYLVGKEQGEVTIRLRSGSYAVDSCGWGIVNKLRAAEGRPAVGAFYPINGAVALYPEDADLGAQRAAGNYTLTGARDASYLALMLWNLKGLYLARL